MGHYEWRHHEPYVWILGCFRSICLTPKNTTISTTRGKANADRQLTVSPDPEDSVPGNVQGDSSLQATPASAVAKIQTPQYMEGSLSQYQLIQVDEAIHSAIQDYLRNQLHDLLVSTIQDVYNNPPRSGDVIESTAVAKEHPPSFLLQINLRPLRPLHPSGPKILVSLTQRTRFLTRRWSRKANTRSIRTFLHTQTG